MAVQTFFSIPTAQGNVLPQNKWFARSTNPPAIFIDEMGRGVVVTSGAGSVYLVAAGTENDFQSLSPVSGVSTQGRPTVLVDSEINVDGADRCQIILMEFDHERKRLGNVWINSGCAAKVLLNDQTKYVLAALRIAGEGRTIIEQISINLAPGGGGEGQKRLEYAQNGAFNHESLTLDRVLQRLDRTSSMLSNLDSDLKLMRDVMGDEPIKAEERETVDKAESSLVGGWKNHPQTDFLLRSKIFDARFYSLASGGVFLQERDAASHFLAIGMSKMHSCNVLIDVRRLPQKIKEKWKGGDLASILQYLNRPRTQLPALSDFFDPKLIEVPGRKQTDHRGGCLGWFMENARDTDFLPTERFAIRWGDFKHSIRESCADHLMAKQLNRPRAATEWDPKAEDLMKARIRAKRENLEHEPLVSIIMPTWNRAGILPSAIDSVIAQTYGNWELLVVDDGSEDNSRDVVREIAMKEPRVRLVEAQHAGVCSARNRGIEKATGRFLAFLDSDNQWEPDFLELMVTEMSVENLRFAYAALELNSETGQRYRAFPGGHDALRVLNHIDLNILVADTALVREAGGFDENLKRWVDHDLALRLARIEEPVLIPFVGCRYDDAIDTEDRITNSESDSWQWVVLGKEWVDWAKAEQTLNDRVKGRVSVVIPMYGQHEMTYKAILAILNTTVESDVEIVVVDNGSDFESTWRIRSIFSGDSRVRFLRLPRNLNFAIGSNYGAVAATGEFVLFLNNDTEVREGWLPPLINRLSEPNVVGVQPLLLFPDDSIQSAGSVFVAHDAVPVPFLARMPREDAVSAGALQFKVVTAAALLMRADDLVKHRGFDPCFVNGMEDVDLCLRMIGEDRYFVVEPKSIVHHHESKTPGRGARLVENRRIFVQKWRGRLPAPQHDLFAAAGFEVSSISTDGLAVAAPRARLRRLTSGVPRWGIKYSANGGPRGDKWGDTFFVHSLSESLERQGRKVVTYRHGANIDYDHALDDVNLVIRGIDRVGPIPGQINVLWVISHPEDVTVDELSGFDLVFAASASWARRMSRKSGRPIKVLHQATDVKRFNLDVSPSPQARPATFVGSVHVGRRRAVVEDALSAHIPLCVIGGGWKERLPSEVLEAERVDNAELASVYKSASRVLADHWPEMAQEGFVQNRLFDAVASGSRVVSDEVEGIKDIFGNAVQTYSTQEELRYLCSEEALKEFPSDTEMVDIAQQIAADHSFDARAHVLVTAVEELISER